MLSMPSRLLINWLAICGLLLNGLLPLAAQAAAPTMAICSVAAPAALQPAPQKPHALTSCLDCCTGAHHIALHAASGALPAPVALLSFRLPPAQPSSTHLEPAFRHAQPRAPPAI